MTSKARRIVGWLFLIALNVQTILFGPLIIQNLKDTERATSLASRSLLSRNWQGVTT
jgi:hypothetical protein